MHRSMFWHNFILASFDDIRIYVEERVWGEDVWEGRRGGGPKGEDEGGWREVEDDRGRGGRREEE